MKIFFCVAVLLFLTSGTSQLTVQTDLGFVKGVSYPVGPYIVHGFRNIPFAVKPVEDLRFQLPKRNEEEYEIEGLKATAQHRCPQQVLRNFRTTFQGDEDCLYLDIYFREEDRPENSSLPVLVYFHGGNFLRGSKEDYGPDFLLRFGNVVLVVPNYRLGILGFLNNHDPDLPANLGLWDQRLALQWVSENIDHFGGDPKKVAIAGHEAGGMSVGLHVLSHASQDYFQSAISISGCALTPSLFDDQSSVATRLKVVGILNCEWTSSGSYLTCLQGADLDSLMDIQTNLRQEDFLPSVDVDAEDSIVPMHPRIMYQKGCQKDVKYLVGYATNDVSAEVKKEFPQTIKYQHLDKIIGHFLWRHFGHSPNFDAIVRAVKYHYTKGLFIPSFESIEPKIVSILTDFLFKSPLEELRQFHGRENVFLYLFQKDDQAACSLGQRPCYGDEFYLFNHGSTSSTSRESAGLAERMHSVESFCGVWTNFVSFGHPAPHEAMGAPGTNWDHMELSPSVVPKSIDDATRDDVEFWSSLVLDLMTASNATLLDPPGHPPVPHQHNSYSVIGSWEAAALAILCSVLCVALVGMVIVTRRRSLATSVLKVSSRKDVRFSRVNECV